SLQSSTQLVRKNTSNTATVDRSGQPWSSWCLETMSDPNSGGRAMKTLLAVAAAINIIAAVSVPIPASAQDSWPRTAVVNAGSGLVIVGAPVRPTAVVVPL